jgi:hypothetical protein
MEVFNDLYPGNLSVMESLISAIETEGVIAFTGAGTSMPELPSWHALIQKLIQDSHKIGLITPSLSAGVCDPTHLTTPSEAACRKRNDSFREFRSKAADPLTAHAVTPDRVHE